MMNLDHGVCVHVSFVKNPKNTYSPHALHFEVGVSRKYLQHLLENMYYIRLRNEKIVYLVLKV